MRKVPEHLKHLPASCGNCGHDHRFAVARSSSTELAEDYGRAMVARLMILSEPAEKIDPKDLATAEYWKELYETELTHRFKQRPLPTTEDGLLDKIGSLIQIEILDLEEDSDDK